MAKRKVAPLTDNAIKNAKSKEKDYLLPDGNGLYLNIKTIGTKVWTIRYTIDGKAKKTTFGNYPTVSLLEARRKRDEYQSSISTGVDPVNAKKEAKRAKESKDIDEQNTFKKLAHDWLKIKKSGICETHYKKT